MKSLVLYDSQFGNTQKVAEVIAEKLGGTSLRIHDFQAELLHDLDVLVVGSPIQGWRPTDAIVNKLASLPDGCLKGMKTAAFDTRIKIFFSGTAADKIDKLLVHRGGTSIAKPAFFYVKGTEGPLVEGELERAGEWAEDIARRVGGRE